MSQRKKVSISFPHRNKETIILSNESFLYVVICKMNDGAWVFADFWSKKYTSRHYLKALRLKKEIYNDSKRHCYWAKKDFGIAKIIL